MWQEILVQAFAPLGFRSFCRHSLACRFRVHLLPRLTPWANVALPLRGMTFPPHTPFRDFLAVTAVPAPAGMAAKKSLEKGAPFGKGVGESLSSYVFSVLSVYVKSENTKRAGNACPADRLAELSFASPGRGMLPRRTADRPRRGAVALLARRARARPPVIIRAG